MLGTVLIQKIMFSSNKYATLMRYHARNYNLIGWLMNKTIWVLLISSLLISTTIHAESCEKKWAKYYAGKSWFEPWCDTESYKRRHQDAYADEYIPSAGEIEAMHAEQEAKTAQATKTTQAGKIAKAAKEGDATAQASLGWMFYKGGQGVAQNYDRAVVWWRKAAEQGDVTSQANLGIMYANGQGVAQDYKLAYVWSSVAAANGDSDAVKTRDLTASMLTPTALSEAQTLAGQYFEKYRSQQ
ncbi:tetratricopeptide repeat protein [Aeromonas salmonicida subsp. pectinolytica]